MTWDEAAAATGLHRWALYDQVSAGRIRHRGVRVRRGVLDRASVEQFAEQLQVQRAADERRRRAREAEAQARAARRGPPPESGEQWLDIATAAAVAGVSAQWLGRLAAADRLPATRRGRRWWLRRADVEQWAAARVFCDRFRPGLP